MDYDISVILGMCYGWFFWSYHGVGILDADTLDNRQVLLMAVYYNEIDKFCCAWIRELIKMGMIPDGEIDNRSIADVSPDDLNGFTQCHFFAGIGGWAYALKLAGWPENKEVWTGSCPCQPFSSAGMRKGVDDERHLWPEFYRLISARRPITVIGEQVSGKDARTWWDIVYNDLEKAGYARGAINTCACSTGAPHIRQRLYWMAHSGSIRYGGRGEGGSSWFGQSVQAEGLCTAGELANPAELRCGSYTEGAAIQGQCAERGGEYTQSEYAWKLQERFKRCGRYGELGDSQCEGLERQSESERGAQGRQEQTGCTVNAGDVIGGVENAYKPRCEEAMQDGISWDKRPSGSSRCPMPTNGFWANPDWLWCRDKKWRPIESGIIPLASRLSKGMVPGRDCRAIRQRLKGYGNAIVIPQAVEFIKCVMEIIDVGY